MLRPIDNWYLQQEDPARGCLEFVRAFIIKQSPHITEAWKYGMPFFCYKGKMFCYLWFHRQYRQPYLGIVEGKHIHHPALIAEKRARMKILLLDPATDLPVEAIGTIIKDALLLYQ